MIIKNPIEQKLLLFSYLLFYVTVYRKTRHNVAPFEFFFALTKLSASRHRADRSFLDFTHAALCPVVTYFGLKLFTFSIRVAQ